MDFTTRIKIAANKLIFGKSRGTKQLDAYDLANHVNRSYNYLWKIADVNSEHPMPLEVILPIMKLKNNFELLDILCWECGGVFVKAPKTKASRGDENDIASNYQELCVKAVACLLEYLKKKNAERYDEFTRANKGMITGAIAVQKYCDKQKTGQLEFDF